MFHFETKGEKEGSRATGVAIIVALPASVRPPRRWKLRNPRNADGPPLTAAERLVSTDADLFALVGAIVAQALEDLDAGYGEEGETANERYNRAQAYLWFFHGTPTGFERFLLRLGLGRECGRLPAHPLFNDAPTLAARRADLCRLGLPADLFDRRIAYLERL